MTDKKLESFKIGDKQKPRVKAAGSQSSKAKGAEEPQPQAQTFGFARIEGILDNEPPSEVSRNLSARRDALKAVEDAAQTAKEKAAAKKAILAVDRTTDLLDYLFRTKAAMLAPVEDKKAGKAVKGSKGKARK